MHSYQVIKDVGVAVVNKVHKQGHHYSTTHNYPCVSSMQISQQVRFLTIYLGMIMCDITYVVCCIAMSLFVHFVYHCHLYICLISIKYFHSFLFIRFLFVSLIFIAVCLLMHGISGYSSQYVYSIAFNTMASNAEHVL